MNHIAKNLRTLREAKGLNQSDFEDIGAKRTTWNNYERGQSVPKPEMLLRMARRFGVTLEDLISQDLTQNVHLIKITPEKKAEENVPENVHPSVHLMPNLVQEREAGQGYGVREKSQMPQVVVVDPQGKENVVLVSARARAGYLSGYGDAEYMEKLPSYRLPGLNNGTFRAFEVQGASMEPMLYEKDIAVCRWVEHLAEIKKEQLCVLVTNTEGIAIKRALSGFLSGGRLILGSENPAYPPIVVDHAEILEIWQPVAYLSTRFRPQTPMETRLSELESRLIRLEDAPPKKPLK